MYYDIKKIKVVFNGAGASAISCAKMFMSLGVLKENIFMCDSRGLITKKRENSLSFEKKLFMQDSNIETLEEVIKDANVFIGLSKADTLTTQMLNSMAKNPIVFAMANPNPEIDYNLAMSTRSDLIMGTGRSDYPNQINNVLGFPFIFRGALDVKASYISENMKMAASIALSELAKTKIPKEVEIAYGETFEYGEFYIVPKAFDPRVIEYVSSAVAKAACDEGIARKPIKDFEKYKKELRERIKA